VTHNVQLLVTHAEQLEHIGAPPGKVFEGVAPLAEFGQAFVILPLLLSVAERDNVERLAVVDGKGEHVAVRAELVTLESGT